MTIYYLRMNSPVDELLIVGSDTAVTGIYFVNHKRGPLIRDDWQGSHDLPAFKAATQQLEEYFAGNRRTFDFPMRLAGTDLQQQVFQELARIPFGETITYGELARRLGRPTAVRAVASAVGRNPLSIVVPCHRVIGGDGSLTGFAGGVERKRFLLDFERKIVTSPMELPLKQQK